MRWINAFVLVLAICSATPSAAQTASASANASITLTRSVGLSTLAHMGFGSVPTHQGSATVHPISGGTKTGRFYASGYQGSSIKATWTAPAELVSSSGATIPFSDGLFSGNQANTQSSSVLLTNGSTVQLSGTGEYWFWFGGTVTFPSTQPTGTYTGSVTLTIEQVF